MSLWFRAAVVGAAVVLAAGCFFTDSINDRPVAKITRIDDEAPYKGIPIGFDAAKSYDDNDDELEAHWRAFACEQAEGPCDSLDVSVDLPDIRRPFELTVPLDLPLATRSTIQVALEVEDRHGATADDSYRFVLQNRGPVIEVDVQGTLDPGPGGGFVLGLPVDIVAEARDDESASVTLAWEYRAPSGSNPNVVEFAPEDESTYRLLADVPGLWTIVIEATDSDGMTSVTEEPVLIEIDHAPCVALTDPVAVSTPGAHYILDRSEGPRRFAALSVVDALDVYPLSATDPSPMAQASFSWKIATPDTGGILLPIAGHIAADYVLDPGAFSPGQLVTLQIEARDRVARTFCPIDEPTCAVEASRPDCLQRLTWSVEIR